MTLLMARNKKLFKLSVSWRDAEGLMGIQERKYFNLDPGNGVCVLHLRRLWDPPQHKFMGLFGGYFAYSVLGGWLYLPWSNWPFCLLTKTLGSQFHIPVRGMLFGAPSFFKFFPTRPQVHQSLRRLLFRSGSYPGSIICYYLCRLVTNLILTTILVARLYTIILPPFVEGRMEARRG